jgi:hypothetical protein
LQLIALRCTITMSNVQFQKEQVRVTEGVVGRDQTTAHKIGEALTGGKQQAGYLAV